MQSTLFRRRLPANDTTDQHLIDHSTHRHFIHPTDHPLPQGTPNRADELVWVATQIELHAAAGTLDDGNPHVLDAEIVKRLEQWNQAVAQEAAGRRRTAQGLHAEEMQHLVMVREQVADLRVAHLHARAENSHWRALLLGAAATHTITTETQASEVGDAASNTIRVADVPPTSIPHSAIEKDIR